MRRSASVLFFVMFGCVVLWREEVIFAPSNAFERSGCCLGRVKLYVPASDDVAWVPGFDD
jgi:hypothetical protein